MKQKVGNRAAVVLAWGVLALVVVIAGELQSRAQVEIAPFDPHFPFGTADIQGSPMLGVAPGQTLRWSAVNVDTANTCQVELSILDSAGNPVAPSQTATLVPGAASFLDFRAVPPAPRSPAGSGEEPLGFSIGSSTFRQQVRAIARLLNNTECVILLSAEAFDSLTLRTQYVVVADPLW